MSKGMRSPPASPASSLPPHPSCLAPSPDRIAPCTPPPASQPNPAPHSQFRSDSSPDALAPCVPPAPSSASPLPQHRPRSRSSSDAPKACTPSSALHPLISSARHYAPSEPILFSFKAR
eukprot:3736598-Rhodomonas_salina.3